MAAPLLSVFARWPTPGQAKTRLIPRYGQDGAARIYAKLLEHTVRVARESGLSFELRVTGGKPQDFEEWLGHDFPIVEQGDGDLTARLSRVGAPGLAIGSDCPGLTANLLLQAAEELERVSYCVGPANDGGYWLIGFREASPWLFDAVRWSTDTVLPETLQRIAARGHDVALLPELSDVDEPEDLEAWPDLHP